MLSTASEEIARADAIWKSSNVQSLREQQEEDFGHWGPHEFEMPKEEGKWDNVTTNSPKVLSNKIVGLLASSWLQLYIEVGEENKKKRKTISNTEKLANGIIWLADRAIRVPSKRKLQASLSSYATLRGGTAQSVFWYVDSDDKPKCDIRAYDPLWCQWIEGADDIAWFSERRPVSKLWVEKTFKKQILEGLTYDVGSSGQTLMYTFWDSDEFKVAIGNKYVESEGEVHNLGYIPVYIRPCGPVPYLNSDNYSDTMKWSWMSCFANNRDIYDLESKMLSIEASKAIESGKIKIAGDWDSQASGNKPPQGLERLGYGAKTRNEIILFDSAKGQKFGGMIQPPDNRVVDEFLTRIRGMDVIGSIDPIAFGQMTRSGSGALAAELRAAALEFISPFQECVEDSCIWVAEEGVRQFKDGSFEKITIEGRDRKKEKFSQDILPKDVEEYHFECNLVADRLRDELQELGAAIQKVQYGLSSKRTAMLKHNIVEDPDKEQDIMDEELAAKDPVFQYDKLAKYFKDQGTPEGDRMALYYESLSALTIQKTVEQALMQQLIPAPSPPLGGQLGGDGGKPPLSIPLSPQAQAMRMATEAQRPTEQA